MSACNLPLELRDEGIKIKEYLNHGHHESEAITIDYFLCQYDYKNIYDKLELLKALLSMFHVRAYGDLYIPNISFVDWNAKLSNFRNLLSQLNDALNKESSLVTFEKFKFNDIEYSVKRDSFNWIILPNCIVLVLKANEEYFEDNLMCLDYCGNVLWSSIDNIECSNRRGACFVGLSEYTEELIIAHAYVGINYTINAVTGEIQEKKIVR